VTRNEPEEHFPTASRKPFPIFPVTASRRRLYLRPVDPAADFPFAILSHYRLLLGSKRRGPRENPEPAERWIVWAASLAGLAASGWAVWMCVGYPLQWTEELKFEEGRYITPTLVAEDAQLCEFRTIRRLSRPVTTGLRPFGCRGWTGRAIR